MTTVLPLFEVVLAVSAFLACTVLGQVATLCRPNERFLSCGGCQKTCDRPAPACAAVCREGCYCPEDLVRNATGHCVLLSQCPTNYNAYKENTSEPRAIDHKCPDNEEYRFCEPCTKTCDNPNPICPAQCNRGCFCKNDMVRNSHGVCVHLEECIDREISNTILGNREVVQRGCPKNQVFKVCGTCEKTCSNPNPICPAQCTRGCFCRDGFVKTPDDQCVLQSQCPKAEMFGAYELTVEDCAPDEEYLSCGWCEPTCSEPHPQCPIGVCTRGCLCRPPLLRHYSGQCVEPKNCLPQKCPHSSEEYVCRYGCESRCGKRASIECARDVRPRGCSLGCHCKLGLLRDDATGLCVAPEHCTDLP